MEINNVSGEWITCVVHYVEESYEVSKRLITNGTNTSVMLSLQDVLVGYTTENISDLVDTVGVEHTNLSNTK